MTASDLNPIANKRKNVFFDTGEKSEMRVEQLAGTTAWDGLWSC